MTQMGLEYMKHKETARHNVQDEGIRNTGNVINQQDADTRRYTASFEPIKTQAIVDQSRASMSQADTAAGKLDLDAKYRERETKAKEDTAQSQIRQAGAAESQADTATRKAEAEHISRLMDDLSVQQAAEMAYQQLTGDTNAINTGASGFSKFFEQYASLLARAAGSK
nr:MAG: hypothetical protein [Owegonang virus 29]